jgi:signal transduction histidine kinase/ligand-binding sensor domain-containing protein
MIRSLVRPALVLVLGSASTVHALDPGRATSQYVVTKWGAGTLPSATIHALLQTRDRYLWLGTTTGLVRFDGATFTVFNARSAPAFGDGGVSRLAEAADGSLYIGKTSGTVLAYKAGAFTRSLVPGGTALVSSLFAAQDGSLWVGIFGRRMVRLVDGQAVPVPGAVIQAPLAVAQDASGGVWIGSREAGLVRWDGRELEPVDVTRDSIQALHFDRAGTLWIGTPHGLLRSKDGRTERLTREHGLSHPNVAAILEDRDGNLWVGTAGGGVDRLSRGRWTHLTTAEGLSDDDVRCLFEDRDGNLWVGTADGLNRVSDGQFITYGRLEGLDEPVIPSVTGGADGSVWVGTASGGVARLRGGAVEHFDLPAGVGRDAVLALHESRDGSLWIALDNARVFRLRDGRISEHTPVAAEKDWKVRAFVEDEKGPLFLVAALGLARLEGQRLAPVDPAGPRTRYPHMAYRGADGTLWLGDLYGLERRRGGTWQHLAFGEGSSAPNQNQSRVRWVSGEPDGSIWAATIGGLAYVKGDTIAKVTVEQGLPENYLRLVLDDGLGHLWIASMGYIFRLDKQELLDVFAGRKAYVSPLIFDTSDGLKTTEGLLGNTPGFRASDGRLWFGTGKGVSVVDPARIPTQDPAPPVSIEQVTVDGRTERLAAYPPGRGEVTIDYTTLSFRAPSKLRFRHRLDGLDRDWVEAGATRRAYYSNLSPGRYRFSVMACNWEGAWNDPPAVFDLVIDPPFHRTASFYLACGALAAAAVFAAYRIRVNQMRGRFAAILQERTRIARELHDTLAQGLAGVKFQIDTALATIAHEPDVARESIQFAGSMVTSSLAEVRRSIWVLRAQAGRQRDGFGSTVTSSLAQLTADSAVVLRTRVGGEPRPLSQDIERNLLRIAHEAVTNALRHARARTLAVDLTFEPEAVCLRVRDDGCGFDPDTYLHGPRGEHFGLLGIFERAESLGGELNVKSRAGEGTEIECRLPYDCRADRGEAESGEGASL